MKTEIRQYEAVIFDMDGVLIDSKDLVEAFWYEKLDHYGIEVAEDELELKFHGRPARLIIDDLFADLSKSDREEMAEECARYDASVTAFRMIPGVEGFLKSCSDAGIPLALVTSALPQKVERMLEGLAYPSPFDVVVTADLVENGKPDPECYLLATKQLDADPNRVLVFEDSISGTQAASRAGAVVVGINEPHLAGALTEAGARLVIPDFRLAELQNRKAKTTFLPNRENPEISFVISAGKG